MELGDGRRAVLAAAAVSTVSVLPPFLTGALSVQLRADLEFGAAALGVAVATSFAVAAVASALAGRTVERLGPAAGMRAAALLSAVALSAMAAAPSFSFLTGALAVAGVGNAAAQAGSNLLLARGVPVERRATAFGIKQSAIPAAMLVGGLAVPAVALTVGWRWAFGGAGALALASTALVPAANRARPTQQHSPGRAPLSPMLVLLAAAGGLGAVSANTLGAFLVVSSVEAGVSEGAAGLLYALGSAVGLAARVFTGLAADRSARSDTLPVVGVMLLGGSAGFALLATGSTAALVPGVVLAFGLGWGWPGLFNWAVVHRHPHAPAAATGITQTGVYLGALTGPLVFGLIAERASFGAAWVFALACSVAGALAVVAARRWEEAGRPSTPATAPVSGAA
ncbi:MAG: MFS transporter [Actinobacteria bacterium]|nr:MFS transporter [Actinomycetota bacterium]